MQFLQQESKQTFPENLKSKKRDYHFQTEVVLPLFGNDTARQLFIGFTPFFRQIGQFLNFRNEIYKT